MGLTFLDIFAGVGGFRLGMEQAGHRCIGYIEWDKFARASYQAIHNTEKEWTKHDINDVKPGGLPKADVWCFGFPCHKISALHQEKPQDLKEQDQAYFIKRLNFSTAKKKKINLNTCSLKTLKTCFQLMEDETLPRFSLAWMKLV